MVVEYTTNYADFKAAQALVVRSRKKHLVLFYIFQRIVPVLGAIALLLLIWDIAFWHFSLPSDVAAILGCTAFLGFWFPLSRYRTFRKRYRDMKNGRSDSHPILLELGDSEFIAKVPGRGESRLLPAALLKFVEDERVALLYLTPKNFLLLPKHAMNDEQWQTLRTWLRTKTEGRIAC